MSNAQDPAQAAARRILRLAEKVFGIGYGKRTTCTKVIEEATATTGGGAWGGRIRCKRPNCAPPSAAAVGENKRLDAGNLGRWLRCYKDRIFDDACFTNQPKEKGGSEWWVNKI